MTETAPEKTKTLLIQQAYDRGIIHTPCHGACFEDDRNFMYYPNHGWSFWYNDKDGSTRVVKEK